jgi:hypothetical protein
LGIEVVCIASAIDQSKNPQTVSPIQIGPISALRQDKDRSWIGAFSMHIRRFRQQPVAYFLRGPEREFSPSCATHKTVAKTITRSSEETMRSDLIFGAMTNVPNRFLLTRLASKATRRFHRPNTRIEDTANEVFNYFSRVNPLAAGPYEGNLQPFPSTTQGQTVASYHDLEQSVA